MVVATESDRPSTSIAVSRRCGKGKAASSSSSRVLEPGAEPRDPAARPHGANVPGSRADIVPWIGSPLGSV